MVLSSHIPNTDASGIDNAIRQMCGERIPLRTFHQIMCGNFFPRTFYFSTQIFTEFWLVHGSRENVCARCALDNVHPVLNLKYNEGHINTCSLLYFGLGFETNASFCRTIGFVCEVPIWIGMLRVKICLLGHCVRLRILGHPFTIRTIVVTAMSGVSYSWWNNTNEYWFKPIFRYSLVWYKAGHDWRVFFCFCRRSQYNWEAC
jgi:hypothetical protein